MQAMILAAGAGTRLRPLTNACPKPMLPIQGKPLLVHTLHWLKRYGITDIALNVHHLPDIIQQGVGDGAEWGLRLHYSFESQLLGTAGAVKRLASFFTTTFVVVYGDLLLDVDLEALAMYHRSRRALVTLGLKPTDTPHSQGMVECDPSGRVVRFVEKPVAWISTQHTANAGVYVAEPTVLDYIPDDRSFDWGHDVFPLLIAAGAPIYARPVTGQVVDIGTLEAYERVKEVGLLNSQGSLRLNQS